ncbi:MAG: branched chain amino acid aminotransferase, partial [Gammaproteobacteria bacterium]|nr:branched chain amino acid aminotransferase [Gammaproteobacteria bacterium]
MTNAASSTAKMPKFGTHFTEHMAIAWFKDGAWQDVEITPVGPIPMHPAAHVLHYGSACFEGLKAFRTVSGEVRLFRLDMHVARMRQSAEVLCLPQPDE